MEKLINFLISIIAGAASGDPASYAAFFCLAVVAFLVVAGCIKLSGFHKLLVKAWEKYSSEDDTYGPDIEG